MSDNPDVPEESRKAWDQLPGEPAKHYAAFKVYLSLGSKRSVRATEEAVGKGNKRSEKRPHTKMEKWAAKWQWVERSAAYDLDQAGKALTAAEVDRQDIARAFDRSFLHVMNVMNHIMESPDDKEYAKKNLPALMLFFGRGTVAQQVGSWYSKLFGEKLDAKVHGRVTNEVSLDMLRDIQKRIQESKRKG